MNHLAPRRLVESAASASLVLSVLFAGQVAAEPQATVSPPDGAATVVDPLRTRDAHIRKPVDLDVRGGDLQDLMDDLGHQLGVHFHVSPVVADWKLTVIANRQPAMRVMQQVSALFSLQWRREPGASGFAYSLEQSAVVRAAAEAERDRVTREASARAVDGLRAFSQFLGASSRQMAGLAATTDAEADAAPTMRIRSRLLDRAGILRWLSTPEGQDAMCVYLRLTPAQIRTLKAGHTVTFAYGAGSHDLPAEIGERRLTQALKREIGSHAPPQGVSREQVSVALRFGLAHPKPNTTSLYWAWIVKRRRDRSDPARVTGEADTGGPLINVSTSDILPPDNARWRASAANDPAWRKRVSLQPEPLRFASLPSSPARDLLLGFASVRGADQAQDWIDSADYLSELHRKTGWNIVSDYFLRLYPRAALTVDHQPLLDVLTGASDVLGAELSADGPFLRLRSPDARFLRRLDVPNRWLRRWSADRTLGGSMPLTDVIEMAEQPDDRLDDLELQRTMLLRWGLEEWMLAANARLQLRFCASLTADQQAKLRSGQGLSVAALSPAQAEKVQDMNRITFRQMFGNWDGYGIPGLDRDPPPPPSRGRLLLDYGSTGDFTWTDHPGIDVAAPVPVGHEDVRSASRSQAAADVARRLTSRRASAGDIARAQREIAAPEARFWLRLYDGNKYQTWYATASGLRS